MLNLNYYDYFVKPKVEIWTKYTPYDLYRTSIEIARQVCLTECMYFDRVFEWTGEAPDTAPPTSVTN